MRKEAKEKSISLEDVFYQHGISEHDVLAAKSELFGYPSKELGGSQLPFETLHDIPEESARFYKMVPLEGGRVTLMSACSIPTTRRLRRR